MERTRYTEEKYRQRLKTFLEDKSICKENKQLYEDFFEHQEYKLKRINDLPELDTGCLITLNGYIARIKNVNRWFNDKPLKDITKEDIKRVYDGLEDGKLLGNYGKPIKDRVSYYNKIFRSKLFRMVGKAELSREVMEFHKPKENNDVRFITEEDFRKLVDVMINIKHKALAWLSWDVGENINSLLSLTKRQCTRQKNPDTQEDEYMINFPKEILKRSRKERSEITNYPETVKFLDILLKDLQENDKLFHFQYAMAKKLINRAVRITGVKTLPKGDSPTWKDLRSGMACDLLKKGWTTDEVNSRLGHKPSSTEIDKYINFLAIDRHKTKKKVQDNALLELKKELEQSKQREKLYQQRQENLQGQVQEVEKLMDKKYKTMETYIKTLEEASALFKENQKKS